MPTPAPLPGFEALGGKSRNFRNVKTGAVLSRRQYEKLRGIFFEKKAAENKLKDAEAAILRPAKGRSSGRKLAPAIKKDVAAARLERAQQLAEQEAERAKMAAKVRTVNRKAAKKVHVKTVRDQLLKAGNYGARISFNNYEDYVKLYGQIQKMGAKVFAYGLGIIYIVGEERTNAGEETGVTVFTMRLARDPIISEAVFDERMQADIQSRSYMKFAHYFMHVAFAKKFAQDKAKRAGIKRYDLKKR